MIEREQFAKVMGAFADRIGRALTPFTYDVYYDTLSESLTTGEFLAGARIVFKTHTFNTWPAPQQFIDAIKPPAQHALKAAELFEQCRRIVAHHGYTKALAAKAEIDQLGPAVARAFRAAGGIREFTNALEEQVPFLRHRFTDAFEAAATETEQRDRAATALDAGALDPRVLGLVKDTTRSLTSSGRDRALPPGDRDVA